MTAFTNIHVAPAAPAAELDQTSRLPRLRSLTNDPSREYAQRPGEVERLPDSIAALILCKKGFSKVQRNGIVVEGISRKPLKFWCEHSVTIATKAGTNEKVLWTLNRLQPDLLHILTPAGAYVETIPLDGKVPWFDAEATQKVLGAKRRSQNRIIERVQQLHAPDSEDAAEAATANEAEMKSAVHTFPTSPRVASSSSTSPSTLISPNGLTNQRSEKSVPHPQVQPRSGGAETKRLENGGAPGVLVGENLSSRQRSNTSGFAPRETVELPSSANGRSRSSARGSFEKSDRIHEIQRGLDAARKNHEDRQHVRKQAAAFGSAISRSQIPGPKSQTPATTSTEIEEW